MNTGERLSQLFKDKNVTAYEVSVRTHISQATLSRILNRKTDKLSIKITDMLADYFSVNREWLVSGKGEKSVIDKKYNVVQTNESHTFHSGKDVNPKVENEQLKVKVKELEAKVEELKRDKSWLMEVNKNLAETLKNNSKKKPDGNDSSETMSEGSEIKKVMEEAV